MTMSSSLLAKLRFVQLRHDRVAHRIDSLCDAAWQAPTPAVSVFRRADASDRPTMKVANSGALRSRVADAVHAPTAQVWAPA